MKKTLLLLLFVYLFIAPPVLAEAGLSISPPLLEVVIKPGKNITQVYAIQNLSDEPLTLVAKIIPFEPSDSGLPILRPDQNPSWLSYFSLANAKIRLGEPFTMQPNQKDQLVVNISIPNTANLIDHYATIILTSEQNQSPTELANNPTAKLTTAVASNIILSVNQVENPPTILQVENFAPLPQDVLFKLSNYYLLDNLNPIHFQAKAVNTGAHYTQTGGLFKITANDRSVSLQGLIPLNVLAGSSREIAASPSGQMVFNPTLATIGLHKAILDLRNDNSTSHAEINLFIFPFKFFAGLILAIVLLILILKTLNKTSENQLTSKPKTS